MINNLNLAIRVTKQFQHSEVVVSRGVLIEVISNLGETGHGFAQLNRPHDNPKYPFIHKVFWQGITFISYSQNELRGSS